MDYADHLAVFNDLVTIIANNIWWYQGGADDALKALLKEPDKLRLLLGDKSD